MCGIAGILLKNQAEVKQEQIKKMTDIIQHRGPDAEGFYINKNLGLGHRRLSIIDLSQDSNQPMTSSDGEHIITYNGEIYNYLEIRRELVNNGVKFKTKSDTEVILEAYKAYGVDCVKKFNGMWAFCIYDLKRNKIFLSRDRFGVKPLYYINNDKVFMFGSEAKQIISVYPEENTPDYTSVYRYITISKENIDERSFYKNIKIFPAASSMLYDLNNNKMEIYKFWEVNEMEFYSKWIQGKNPLKTFQQLFENAIELRLRADVEVGACLSGGLDSSAIVGCCDKKFGKNMHTFSSVYDDVECNEEKYIDEVNKFCDTIPHIVKPDLNEKEFSLHIKKINFHHDGPVLGASLYSQYAVMQEIHNKVKVVLDGQGADEMFAGYIPYYSNYISDISEKKGIWNRIKAIKQLAIVNTEWPDIIGAISTDVIAQLVGIENCNMFVSEASTQNNKFRRSYPMTTQEFAESIDDKLHLETVTCSNKLKTQLCNDVIVNSIPSLLHNEDSNSMAFSIESRVPFLDYRLVEFSIALNESYKIRNEWTKWIVRKGCKKYLPKAVYKRKNKMGFPAPFSRWVRSGESKEEIKEIIFAFGERNIVPKETIKAFYDAHIKEEVDMSANLFKFYSLELWLRTCNC